MSSKYVNAGDQFNPIDDPDYKVTVIRKNAKYKHLWRCMVETSDGHTRYGDYSESVLKTFHKINTPTITATSNTPPTVISQASQYNSMSAWPHPLPNGTVLKHKSYGMKMQISSACSQRGQYTMIDTNVVKGWSIRYSYSQVNPSNWELITLGSDPSGYSDEAFEALQSEISSSSSSSNSIISKDCTCEVMSNHKLYRYEHTDTCPRYMKIPNKEVENVEDFSELNW